MVKLEQPDGSTTQSRFDASGRVTASIDALGRETHYELDVATGRLLGITSPDGSQTRWNYNAHGQIVHIVNPGGSSEHIEYDTKGRLTASIDALGHATSGKSTPSTSQAALGPSSVLKGIKRGRDG